MSNSTRKSIADREQTKSHHRIDEERHAAAREGRGKGERADERGRKVEREVSRRAKK